MAVAQRERAVSRETHERLTEAWGQPPGFFGWLRGVNHRTVGVRYMVTAFAFFLVGGVQALILRLQLARPENDLLGLQAYNEVFTMHGSTMMFLFVVPMIEGLAAYFLPLMIGARDLPYPRLNAFGYFTYLLGGLLVYASFFFGTVPDGGWFAYPPLTDRAFSPDLNMDFWLLGVTFVEISAIAFAVEIIVGALKFRAPGMSLAQMPLFVWNMLAVAVMILVAFPALILASTMLEFDRAFGTQFYNPGGGGDPILWQHLFWFFGHPEVYIQFLPAVGIVSMMVPVFSRRSIVGYVGLVLAALAVAFLSFGLWAHHMYATGALSILSASFIAASSLMIAIPNGVQIFTWIATIWAGRPWLRAPFLFILGFIVLFVIGGVTGVMVALPAFDRQAHDSFFVVAHFHYVLIGGVVFPFLAGFHYWFPKVFGRMLGERLGVWTFWTVFIGFNLTFFPMHIVGLMGMPRRIGIYDAGLGWDGYNLLATTGAFVLGVGFLLFVANCVRSLRRGEAAGDDPWRANSLEWATSSPPAQYNFAVIPRGDSRDPLWEERDVFDHDPQEDGSPALAVQLAEPYADRREMLVTTLIDARPEYAVVLPGPTILPLLTSLATFLIFLGFITSYWLTGVGIVAALAALVAWTWPSEPEGEHERPRPPARHEGPRSTAWWGALMFIMFSAAVLIPLLFSYLQIWSANPEWPPQPFERPGLLLPAISTTLLVASGLVLWWGNRGEVDEGDRRMRVGFAVALLLGVGFVALEVGSLVLFGYRWTEHAYASLFHLVVGYHLLTVLVAMGVAGWALVRSYLGHYARGHRNSADVAAMFWYYAVGGWLLVLVCVYLLPYIGSSPREFHL